MRAWAKKKNNGDAIEAEYSLPELPQGVLVPAGGGAAMQQGSAVTNVISSERVAEPQNVATDKASIASNVEVKSSADCAQHKEAAGEQVGLQQMVAESEPGLPSAPKVESEQGAVAKASVARRRAVGSGLSIASMMSGEKEEAEEGEQTAVVVDVQYDPASEEKILAVRDDVVAAILEERPRFVVAFEQMSVDNHTIKVEVPSQTLYEEIVRSQTELLLMVARIAGVNGSLDLKVTINEQIKASRPIKLEDRVKFMAEKNPHFMELKHLLDLEYE